MVDDLDLALLREDFFLRQQHKAKPDALLPRVQITLFFSFSIAGGFLPLYVLPFLVLATPTTFLTAPPTTCPHRILRAKGVDTNLPISTTYRNYVIVYLPGIVATILAGLLMEVPWLGRRYSMAIAAALMGTSLFLFATVDNVAGFVGLNALESVPSYSPVVARLLLIQRTPCYRQVLHAESLRRAFVRLDARVLPRSVPRIGQWVRCHARSNRWNRRSLDRADDLLGAEQLGPVPCWSSDYFVSIF